tara:strand:- start:648 stop:1844 length:1197 start_codon:yes stop_codon:yes gene_type:complete
MNVNQMHIAIQQGVDKINSLQADMLLPQEIDIELNKSMSRFLNTKYGRNNIYGKGFEESQKRIDDLRTLVKEYSGSAIYKERYSNDYFVDQFRLPTDYLYLVNQRSEILINNTDCTARVKYYYESYSPSAYFILPLSHLFDSSISEITKNLKMVADATNLSLGHDNISTLPTPLSANYAYPQDLQALKEDLIDSANWAPGFEIYWEEYGQIKFPNNFIIIVDELVHPYFNWDASVTNANSGVSTPTKLYSSFNLNNYTSTSGNKTAHAQYTDNSLGTKRKANEQTNGAKRKYTFNKFVQQDDIFKLLSDPFNTTKPSSPLTTIRGEYIDIYTSDIFIIDRVKITYIRKPREISLSLGISCELPEHTHQEIVDRTVSSILEGFSDARYKNHQLEVSKNE